MSWWLVNFISAARTCKRLFLLEILVGGTHCRVKSFEWQLFKIYDFLKFANKNLFSPQTCLTFYTPRVSCLWTGWLLKKYNYYLLSWNVFQRINLQGLFLFLFFWVFFVNFFGASRLIRKQIGTIIKIIINIKNWY